MLLGLATPPDTLIALDLRDPGQKAEAPFVLNLRNAKPSYICFIQDLVRIKGGVRIYFSRHGGPLFVTLRETIFRPADEPVDALRPDDVGLDAKLGDELYPTNSHHDFCRITVAEVDGQIGVEVSSYMNLPGAPEPLLKKGFYPALD